MNSNAKLSYLGVWEYGVPLNGGYLGTYALINLGSNKLMGIVLGASYYSSTPGSEVTPTSIAILEQNVDGTLSLNTAKYLADPFVNGVGQIIVADFNADDSPDIFMAAANESPMIPAASTAYISEVDGKFKKIVLADAVEAQAVSLSSLNGIQTIVTAGYGPTDPYYQYNATTGSFTIHNWGNAYSGKIYGSSALASDLLGGGGSELVIGDFVSGPGYAFNSNAPAKLAIYQLNQDSLGNTPAFLASLYFDNKAQYQNQELISEYPGLTHNYRIWEDDFNHDEKSDLLLGVGVWSSKAGWQKSKLQMLQNQDKLQFADVTDQLGQAYDENTVCVDYSMQIIDLDRSGINSYLMAGDTWSTGSKQSSYLMLNDGTGKLYAALHDQFWDWSEGMALKFIPYQLANGAVNYVAQTADGTLYNFPTQYNITTDYTQDITILDRNNSMLMRTWAGDDVFFDEGINANAAHIDGGLGRDTAVYSGTYSQYQISKLGDLSFTVNLTAYSLTAPAVKDTLANVERLSFTDTMLALDTGANENAGNAYLLYQAAFDRVPDVEGLGYWISKVDGGANIVRDVAQNFILSSEFKSLYGANPSVPEFMGLLYQNVLNRTPDAEGLKYWLDEFAQAGDSTLYRAGLLNNFAISAENIANVADQIVDGIQYQAYVG